MEFICRILCLHLGFLLMVNLVYGDSVEFRNQILDAIGRNDQYCLGSESRRLIRFRKMTVRTVDGLWDFMKYLHDNQHIQQNRDDYYMLLYDFQKMYVGCLISISASVGKRSVPGKKSGPLGRTVGLQPNGTIADFFSVFLSYITAEHLIRYSFLLHQFGSLGIKH
uniref:Uncharacterized protein n=1 Tax=Laticauda laticaudata TaxID=8630 RepID=A0A8C5SDZ4_LATLA